MAKPGEPLWPRSVPGSLPRVHHIINPVPCSVIGPPFGSLIQKRVALQREVLEETGIKIELDSIVSLGHFPQSQFERSNLYVVCSAKALSKEINIVDLHEIIEAKWMDIDEFFNCEDIHIYNKNIVKAAMKNKGLKLGNHNYFTNSDNQHEYYF